MLPDGNALVGESQLVARASTDDGKVATQIKTLGLSILEELDCVAILGVGNGLVKRRVGLVADLGNGVGDRRCRTCGGLIVSSTLRCKGDGRSDDDIRFSLRLIGGLGGRF